MLNDERAAALTTAAAAKAAVGGQGPRLAGTGLEVDSSLGQTDLLQRGRCQVKSQERCLRKLRRVGQHVVDPVALAHSLQVDETVLAHLDFYHFLLCLRQDHRWWSWAVTEKASGRTERCQDETRSREAEQEEPSGDEVRLHW